MDLSPQDLDKAFARYERIRHGKEVVTNFTDPAAMEIVYTLAQMNSAEQEKINYPPTKSATMVPSRKYGSDFSSASSQNGDVTPPAGNVEKKPNAGTRAR
jgi:hypothetical protein